MPSGPPSVDVTAGVSPDGAAVCDQDVVEDLLRGYASGHGAQVRWGENVDAVLAALLDRE